MEPNADLVVRRLEEFGYMKKKTSEQFPKIEDREEAPWRKTQVKMEGSTGKPGRNGPLRIMLLRTLTTVHNYNFPHKDQILGDLKDGTCKEIFTII